MLFHSQFFLLIFAPLTLTAYYAFAGSLVIRKWLLILASILFYAYWDPRLAPFLVGSVVVNWLFGRAIGRQGSSFTMVAGVGLNLLIIGFFKYANFFADSLAVLGSVDHEPWNIILPLGISFFTFQQISYLIDSHRDGAPAYAFTDYALYVTFFPQLIAGPIVRHDEIIHQYAASPLRDGLYERLSRGLVLLVIGLVKKTFIADKLALIADPLFAQAVQGGGLTLGEGWTAAAAFGLQIYFDFSGYSDMAIGLGLMFGLTLPDNFNAPYRACSIRDFWRRWHMTLSRFLRDYLYVPLGGNRKGSTRLVFALVVTMLLGGLWHGAGWTFVIWGGLHGVALALEHLWRRTGLTLPPTLGWVVTMLFVFVAWVLFRAETFGSAAHILSAMAGGNGWALSVMGAEHLWLIAVAALVAILGPTAKRMTDEILQPRSYYTFAVAVTLVLVLLQTGGGDNSEFIYFQF